MAFLPASCSPQHVIFDTEIGFCFGTQFPIEIVCSLVNNPPGPHLLIAGFGDLGSALASRSTSIGLHVTGISRGSGTHPHSSHSGLKLISCDLSLRSASEVRNLVGDPDAIAVTLSSRGGGIPGYRSAFLTGTQTLLQAFPGTRILFTSSTSVYGQTDGSDVDESSPTEPERETGRILLEAERIVLSHGGIVARLAG